MTAFRSLCFGLLFALFVGMALLPATARAQADTNAAPLVFKDAGEEARFHALSAELRCVMCQNQSLADSNAVIARDLRVEVLALMRKGMSDAEIKAFLVQRYGEFVLYKPRLSGKNLLLWFGPLLLLVGGGLVLYRVVGRHRPGQDTRAADGEAEGQEW